MHNLLGKINLKYDFVRLYKKYDLKIDNICGHGFDLPDFARCCGGTDIFAGRGIYLFDSYADMENSKTLKEKKSILRNVISDKIFSKEMEMINQNVNFETIKETLYSLFYEELKNAYIDVLKEEEKLGIYRFACTLKYLSRETIIKSKYDDETEINYSPALIQFEDFSDIETLAARFAEAVLKKQSCFLFSIIIKNTSNYKNVNLFARKLIPEFNKFFIDEFNKCKNNEEYQRRYDFNPDFF